MTKAAGKTCRVAICDDAETIRRALKMALARDERIEVVAEAATGVEAIEVARAVRPDVMLLDVSMPELNGIDAIPQVLEASPSTTVLIMSAHRSPETKARALAAGASTYLEKGVGMSDVICNVVLGCTAAPD